MSRIGKAFDWALIKRVYFYFQPYRGIFTFAVVLTLLMALLAPIRPYIIKFTVDNHILLGDYNGLIKMVFLMLSILAVETIVQFLQTYYTSWLGQNAIKDLRKQIFNHLTKMRLRYFDQTPIGTLVTRTISDLEAIAEVMSQGLITISGDLIQIITIIGVMAYVNWKLTLVSLLTLPLLFIATYIFKESVKASFSDVRTAVSRLNGFMQEHITGMSVVQLFNREKVEIKKFEDINNQHKKAHIRSVMAYSIFFPVVEIISSISLGLIVWYGAKEALIGVVTPGDLFMFILFISMLFRPMRMLADKFNTLQMGVVAAERIFHVLDTDARIPDDGTKVLETIKDEVEFQEVYFAYNEEDGDVLKNISFKVKKGETIALVGATGAGKSSIINVLSRFYSIRKGKVLVDGHDIHDYTLDSIRKNISVVLQDVFLFSDTIANNISLRNKEISREYIVAAAKEIGAHEFIMRLPGNYDYNVMERGATLSSGQAQLVSFIRAMIYNPQILVLDEATSSVDSETEALIQVAIEKLMQGRTSIVVAHRLSTIQHADTILVLDKGEIMERGSHQELLQQNGMYKNLYDLQFKSGGIKVS
ncbi:MAG: ATP-binding cassette subfamily B multidrug efflux pump [Sphingobacteriales bacterium]|jgi:ATP-binding cassette subfamily B multidrug efflux pump